MYPARFPVKIFNLFFSKISTNGYLFDPFAGSGSLALAAYLKCFNSIVWDLNPMIYIFTDASIKVIEGFNIKQVLQIINKAMNYGRVWLPAGVEYWWPQEVLDIIGRIWGFFRDNLAVFNSNAMEFEVLDNLWSLYAIVALYVSRKLSYTDDSIPKWYRSKLKINKISKLLSQNDVKTLFERYLRRKIKNLYDAQNIISKPSCKSIIMAKAIDAVSANEYPKDIAGVLTSPPYIQAQEYIRSFKWELKLLGVPDTIILKLKKLEIPYRPPVKLEIVSATYYEVLDMIEEQRFKTLLESYFTNTLTTLEKSAENIKEGGTLGIFVGEATVRGKLIPIVKILKEHLVNKLGMSEENNSGINDEIRKRRLFKNRKNLNPIGIKNEHLIFLKKP
jgi:hypothetical protein